MQAQFAEQLGNIQQTLSTIEDLYHRYTSYQYSYCKLVVELSRRRRYAETAARFVRDMTSKLQDMIDSMSHAVSSLVFH